MLYVFLYIQSADWKIIYLSFYFVDLKFTKFYDLESRISHFYYILDEFNSKIATEEEKISKNILVKNF